MIKVTNKFSNIKNPNFVKSSQIILPSYKIYLLRDNYKDFTPWRNSFGSLREAMGKSHLVTVSNTTV